MRSAASHQKKPQQHESAAEKETGIIIFSDKLTSSIVPLKSLITNETAMLQEEFPQALG